MMIWGNNRENELGMGIKLPVKYIEIIKKRKKRE